MKLRFVVLSLLALLLLSFVSPTVLIPPKVDGESNKVFLIDHGTHTSIVIQQDPDSFIRYAYGDKNYYANRDTSLSSGARALLVPTTSVLARGELERVESEADIEQALPVVIQKVYAFDIGQSKAQALIARLDRIHLSSDEQIEVPAYGLVFADHPSDYHLFSNSSTTISSWLRELGMTTLGWGLIASWAVVEN